MKTLGNSDSNTTTENVRDVQFWGKRDMFLLLSKASSEKEGWMKSTKACDVFNGVIVQVTTQQRNPDGSYAVAEALTYVPGVYVGSHLDSEGNLLYRTLSPSPVRM